MSGTPIIDFIRRYKESGTVRAHMPAHKGAAYIGPEALDITEIAGADELYGAEGIIKASEENAAALFETGRTLYSCEGSSLSIRAMLYLALLEAKRAGREASAETGRFRVLAGRNAHKTLMTAAALLDLDIGWLPAEESSLLRCKTDIRALDELLAGENEREKPIAVYITSPDYLGNIENIRSVAAVCHWHGVPLLVDNAHGTYLKFLEMSMHPIDLGADMCCDSAHKTLPCLTGAAYLHIHRAAPSVFAEQAEAALALFASTSPSYLIMQSLDNANALLTGGYAEKIREYAASVRETSERLSAKDWRLIGDEPLKLSFMPKEAGYTGAEFAAELRLQGIEPEFADPDFCVLMLSPENGKTDLKAIENAVLSLEKRPPISEKPPSLPAPDRAVSFREAILSPQERVPAEKALGRVLGFGHIACPPAVPIVTAGERIGEAAVECFRYYGVGELSVLREPRG